MTEEKIGDELLKAYSTWSVASITLYTVFMCVTPASIILGGLMLIKPMMVTIEANDILQNEKLYDLPAWINDCSLSDQKFPEENQLGIDMSDTTAKSSLNALVICMIVNVLLGCLGLIAHLVNYIYYHIKFERDRK